MNHIDFKFEEIETSMGYISGVVPVQYNIFGAEPDVGIMSQYAECELAGAMQITIITEDGEEFGRKLRLDASSNFDDLVGVAFLPYSDHIYAQAPYQEITEEEYNKLMETMPKTIDWSLMSETQDNTIGSQELACVAGVCEM